METVTLIAGILISILFSTGNKNSEVPYITVPVNYSARSYLSKDSSTLLVVNQFNISDTSAKNQKRNEVIKAEAYSAIKYAESQFKQLPKVKVISLIDSAAFTANADSIHQLASKYKADHVLALKNFDAGIVVIKLPGTEPYYSTSVSVNFKLYESDGLYYKKLAGTDSDTMPDLRYRSNAHNASGNYPPIEKYKAFIDSTTITATQNAIQDYFPSSISHDRPLYDDRFLRAAVKKIYANDLDGAIALLKPELQNPDRKKASKAAYNLAVVYEGKADIEQALAMTRLSIKKHDNPYASAILEDLKKE